MTDIGDVIVEIVKLKLLDAKCETQKVAQRIDHRSPQVVFEFREFAATTWFNSYLRSVELFNAMTRCLPTK